MLAGCASGHNLAVNVPIDGACTRRRTAASEAYSDDLPDRTCLFRRRHASRRLVWRARGDRRDDVAAARGRWPADRSHRFRLRCLRWLGRRRLFRAQAARAHCRFSRELPVAQRRGGIDTQINLATLGRALGGGVNGDRRFSQWLDQTSVSAAPPSAIYARCAGLASGSMPPTFITARRSCSAPPPSTRFAAICNSYRARRRGGSVGAVPIAFAPVVLESYGGRCKTPLPPGVDRARNNPQASAVVARFAEGSRATATAR